MEDCLFCKIVRGEIPSTKVYETDQLLAFRDISPKAKVHLLLIPKRHIPTLMEIRDEDKPLLGELLHAANQVALQEGCGGGFRLVNNCGADGGQEVFHLHFHLLGGERLGMGFGVSD